VKKKNQRQLNSSTAPKRSSEILRKYVNALDVTTHSDAQSTYNIHSAKNDAKQLTVASKRESKDLALKHEDQKRSSSMTNLKKAAKEGNLNISFSSKQIAQRKQAVDRMAFGRSNS